MTHILSKNKQTDNTVNDLTTTKLIVTATQSLRTWCKRTKTVVSQNNNMDFAGILQAWCNLLCFVIIIPDLYDDMHLSRQ